MVKKCVSILGAMGVCGFLFADPSSVTFELTNNQKETFLLEDVPSITYRNDSLCLQGKAATSYAFNDVRKYYFYAPQLSASAEVGNDGLMISYLDNERVEISGLSGQSDILLYNALGQLVKKHSTKEANAQITLPGEKGIYILRVNNRSVKLTKD